MIKKSIGVIFVFCMLVSSLLMTYAQDSAYVLFKRDTIEREVVLDDFDENGDSVYNIEWKVVADPLYVTYTQEKPYPQLALTRAQVPFFDQVVQSQHVKEDRVYNIMGIRAAFNIKGRHFLKLEPYLLNEDGKYKNTDVDNKPIPGITLNQKVSRFGLWVWGDNRSYELLAQFMGTNGQVSNINMGMINHFGWRQMRIQVPSHLFYANRQKESEVVFVRLMLFTTPKERVDDFIFYVDRLYVIESFYSDPFKSVLGTKDYIDSLNWKESVTLSPPPPVTPDNNNDEDTEVVGQ